MYLDLADALNLWRMQAVDLLAPLPLALLDNPVGLIQRVIEGRISLFFLLMILSNLERIRYCSPLSYRSGVPDILNKLQLIAHDQW